MQAEQDTIVAIATPPGRGGVGMVRISGPRARAIAEGLCKLKRPLARGRARYGRLLDDAGQVLDECVVTLFAAPHSYTSEDVVEISAHGSPVLLEWVVGSAIKYGARLARPGEFTQRAFLSGRLDLTQAEAVQNLIAAQTLHQARLAAAQLGGALARRIAPAKQTLIELIAGLEAGIDFAEDDLDLLGGEEIARRAGAVRESLAGLAKSYGYGRIVREGFTLAIVGRPNAGKSSLFNRLLERERAIVTAQPGTTRDSISERLSLGGIPIEMVDTAGLRKAESEAESQGVERTRMVMAEAEVVLHVVDASMIGDELRAEDHAILGALADRPHVVVLNKCDLARPSVEGVLVSAATGEGIGALKERIVRTMTEMPGGSEEAMLTNLRQHGAVAEALRAVIAAEGAANDGLAHELILLDLYAALEALDTLTGQTTTDDVLSLIFSTFCIGK